MARFEELGKIGQRQAQQNDDEDDDILVFSLSSHFVPHLFCAAFASKHNDWLVLALLPAQAECVFGTSVGGCRGVTG